ncbi:alpha/beta hydrolase fold domain-containing protein [Leifsonia sp. AG29]|uniref:alpha/beta hydrolase fold domain-containing protein n=1 Tax=Leifsonia sp. AG29 TaxID=2598860 RepID=UPI00131C3F67|nr:alpha/beta hydrolase fold domain-containing protein [Leifsonia sp. AG29]
MTRAQAEQIEALLRDGPLDLGGPLDVQRPLLDQLMTSHPLPAGVVLEERTRGGVPTIEIAAEHEEGGVILYFHGGAYALGSARGGAGLAAELTTRTGSRAVSVEYRLAPEHPHPAALDDAVAAYRGLLAAGVPAGRIIVAGESAGGGLTLALLLALRDHGEALPAAGIVLSPWADLELRGSTITSKAAVDAALTRGALQTRARDYAAGSEPSHPLLSPVNGDFTGLPPLMVQVGSHEILLDDALRVAARAAEADVAVTLQVTPHMPHVFQGFASDLTEGATALDAAAAFIATHLNPEGV